MYKIYQVYFDDGEWRCRDVESLVIASSPEEAIQNWSHYQHYKDLRLEKFVRAWEYSLNVENMDDFDINVEITKKGEVYYI